MALVVNDRVKETSTTTGTGTFTLDGAVTGFETFSSAIGNSNTTYYAIEIPNSTEFEVGLGTVAAGTLARTTVISSSNSDALVDFSAGTKNVFCTLPASKAVIEDASNNVTLPADLTVGTDTFDVDSTNEKVNIGTTSGSYTGLNVFKKSGPGNIYVHLNGNPGTIIGTSLLSEGTSGDFVINTRDNADIRIYTNNTLRSEFKNNGNFYVDTDTLYVDAVNDKIGIGGIPTERLTVIGANNTSASELKVKDTDGRGILIESPYSGFGVGYVGTDGTNSALGFKVNGTELARFGTNGFLGIGTNNPQEEIHINGADPSIRIQDSDGGFTTITQAGNDLSFDVPGQINLDADSNGLVTISDGGTQIGSFFKTASTFSIKSDVQDKRLEIKGNDGGSEVVAVAFHMANAGQANFNDKIVLYANKVIEFGDAGETISGDGTDLTIASSRHIKLDATNDITLDAGAGGVKFDDDGTTVGLLFNASGDLTFKTVQQDKDLNIKGNDGGSEITALTLDMSEAGAATFNDKVILGASKRLELGDPGEYIFGDGTNLTAASSGYINLSSTGNLLLNTSTSSSVFFRQNDVNHLQIFKTGDNPIIKSSISDGDLIIKGNDGGSEITALTLDMSEAGAATFNDKVILGVNKRLELGDAGEYIYGDGTNLQFVSSNAVGFDAANSITLDGGSGGTILKAGGGTTYGSLINSSGDLIIKSGTTTALTFSGANATLAGNLDVSSGTIKLDGNYPTGNNNVAMGDTALDSLTNGDDNTVIGDGAGTAVTTGQQNTVVGSTALNTGNATGNTAIGFRALRRATGANNTAIGRTAGDDTTTGAQNTFVGGSAGYYINGINNVAVGYQAGNGLGNTGSSNVFMGYRAGNNNTTGSNNIVIGTSANASSATISNEITLGDANITSLRIPGLASGASSGDVLTYDGTDITLSAPTGVSAGFSIAMAIAL